MDLTNLFNSSNLLIVEQKWQNLDLIHTVQSSETSYEIRII
jgi:hypothetical protein